MDVTLHIIVQVIQVVVTFFLAWRAYRLQHEIASLRQSIERSVF